MKPPTEAAVLRSCLDYLRLRKILCWRANNGGVYDPARKRFRSFHGLKGVADILAVLPVDGRSDCGNYTRRFGVLLAVECKAPGKRPSPEQAAFLAAVEAAGGVGCWVTDVSDLAAILDDLGV